MGKAGFALLFVLVAVWIPAFAGAELGEVRVGVDGMTCVT